MLFLLYFLICACVCNWFLFGWHYWCTVKRLRGEENKLRRSVQHIRSDNDKRWRETFIKILHRLLSIIIYNARFFRCFLIAIYLSIRPVVSLGITLSHLIIFQYLFIYTYINIYLLQLVCVWSYLYWFSIILEVKI